MELLICFAVLILFLFIYYKLKVFYYEIKYKFHSSNVFFIPAFKDKKTNVFSVLKDIRDHFDVKNVSLERMGEYIEKMPNSFIFLPFRVHHRWFKKPRFYLAENIEFDFEKNSQDQLLVSYSGEYTLVKQGFCGYYALDGLSFETMNSSFDLFKIEKENIADEPKVIMSLHCTFHSFPAEKASLVLLKKDADGVDFYDVF